MMEYFYYFLISFIWWQFLSAAIVSAGYHRYFTHKSFESPVWYEYIVLLLGPLSGAGHLLGWAGVHRMHHAYSDTEKDPHSPKYKGFWKVFTSTFKVQTIPRQFIKDLIRNKRVMFFYKYHLTIRFGFLLFGVVVLPVEWFIVFFISPYFFGHLGFGLINALCHKDGLVRNSWLAALFTGGEGWHENHHIDSKDWQIGKTIWQIDPGAWFIRLIKVN
jgi:fatty-acid desaturase